MDRFRERLNSRGPRADLPSEEVRAQLDRVLGSQTFSSAPSLSRFLAHVVEQTLNGKQDSLKEYSLGVDVFARGDSFDPKTDTIVRSQARRLRLKLQEYYEGPGRGDPVLIGLGKGRYVADFSVVQPATAVVAVRRRPAYVVAALLVLTVLASGGLRLARVADPIAPSPAEAASARWSLAVLPFQALSSGDDEYLGIGMADSLITRLGLLGSISVRPLAGVRFYADGKKDPQTAGRELRVQSVLDGSLLRDGDRLRVRVRLYRVADGTLLWAEQFDQQVRDIFAVQDSISEKVASALTLEFPATPQSAVNPEAYESFVRGRYFFEQFTREGNWKALDYFERAIRVQPDYARAYAGLAINYAPMIERGFIAASEAGPKLRRAAERALAIDDSLAEAHTAMASSQMADFDWAAAEHSLKQAIALNPNYLHAYGWYSYILGLQGRHEEALRVQLRMIDIDPVSDYASRDFGVGLTRVGRDAEAVVQLQKALELRPDFAPAQWGLARAYEHLRRLDDAHTHYLEAQDPFDAAYVRAMQGDLAPARALTEEPTGKYLKARVGMAALFVALNDKERALSALEKGCDERSAGIVYVKVDERFASLRDEPRFKKILARMHLR